jgi:hypothetical protein
VNAATTTAQGEPAGHGSSSILQQDTLPGRQSDQGDK